MSRAIYDKAIYHREQQMDRKVYDRARNVLPVEPVPPVEEYWTVTSMNILQPGVDFQEGETFYLEGEREAASVVDGDRARGIITGVGSGSTWYIESVSAEVSGSGYQVGEQFTILTDLDEGGVNAVLEVAAVDDNGGILSFDILDPGIFATDVSGEVTTYEYTGSGTGVSLHVYCAQPSGVITSVSIDNPGTYTSDISGAYNIYTDGGGHDGVIEVTASLKSGE